MPAFSQTQQRALQPHRLAYVFGQQNPIAPQVFSPLLVEQFDRVNSFFSQSVTDAGNLSV